MGVLQKKQLQKIRRYFMYTSKKFSYTYDDYEDGNKDATTNKKQNQLQQR